MSDVRSAGDRCILMLDKLIVVKVDVKALLPSSNRENDCSCCPQILVNAFLDGSFFVTQFAAFKYCLFYFNINDDFAVSDFAEFALNIMKIN